ncbi:MAG: magnesium transporter [Oscillospiraceae bacterium]|nr:magnesium transporter [Oscillospiraceae bacterium]
MKEQILELLKGRHTERLKTLLANSEELEILHIFYDLSPEEQVIVFRFLAKDSALSIFEQLDTDLQQNLLQSFTDDKVIEFVNEMAPDDRVRLLDEMPASVANKLINSLSAQERTATNVLMGYEPETAGRIMTPEYISLRKGMTVREALDKVRKQAKDKETIYTLFVTDNSKKLEGVITLKKLLTAEDGVVIKDIMSQKPIFVSTATHQEEAARLMQELDILAISVVDKEERLVGIITIDDALDVQQEAATQDFEIMAGVSPSQKQYLKTSVLTMTRQRVPWLLILMLTATVTGTIISGFEDSLAVLPALVAFIPLLMDTAGNAGSQSSVMVIRGMAVDEIHLRDAIKVLWKEIRVALFCGLFLSAVNFVRILLLNQNIRLNLTVSLTLVCTVVLAKTVGCLLPMCAKKLKLDPAVMASPVITSIADIGALIIFFSIARAVLGL